MRHLHDDKSWIEASTGNILTRATLVLRVKNGSGEKLIGVS